MNYKKLSLGILTLALTANVANAAYYFRFFGGDTLSSLKYQADAFNIPVGGGTNVGTIEHKTVNTVNLFNAGLGMGLSMFIHPKFELGLEADGLVQTQKYKFNEYLDNGETAFLDAGIVEHEIENKFKGVLALMFKINKSFFIKAGPSLLRQGIKTRTFPTNATLPRFSNSETENLFGATMGTGFIYRLTKNFGIFTEYNYSYYPRKNLDTINLVDSQINPPGGVTEQNHRYGNRKIDFSQSEFFFGFVFNFETYDFNKPCKCDFGK